MTVRAEVNPQEKLQDFFKKPLNRDLIKQMALADKRSLEVDYVELSLFDKELAQGFETSPDRYLEYATKALRSQLKIEAPEYHEKIVIKGLHVRVKGIPHKVELRKIGASNLERMISFDGIVVRAAPVRPLIINAVFQCPACKGEMPVPQKGYTLEPPHSFDAPIHQRRDCPGRNFELVLEKSQFIDSQELRVQERPEDLPPGQLPRAIEVTAEDDLVDIARPGDRVTVTGMVQARPQFIVGTGKVRVFNIAVNASHVETVGKEVEGIAITPEDEKQIKEIAKRKFVHRDLVNSIAPSIYGYEDIKEAIVYLLFGGIHKLTPDGIAIRGDVHVLIVGDPGTAKSQLLRYVAKISPRGLYTSGRGTTAAGLTAAVVREKSGGLTLEAGALVLADKGVASVDEIDKMRDEDRVAMHEMMEQQTISVAKGGIVATLNARASILAAANPKLGRYEDRMTVADNINIPIVILSRFDLIFIEKDRPKKELDERLSEHILNVHKTTGISVAPPIDSPLLRKYITYARSRITPRLSDEAVKRLREFYLKMREQSGGMEEAPVAITARQLEALVRLAEARAKAALRDTVTAVDAEAAIKIMQKSLQDVGAMNESEAVDIDTIMTGRPATVREGMMAVVKLVGEMEKKSGEAELEELYKQLDAQFKIDRKRAEDIVKRLLRDGTIYQPSDNTVRRAR